MASGCRSARSNRRRPTKIVSLPSTTTCACRCGRETELFFDRIIKEDRSILEFLDAPWTFMNERLAQHYQSPASKVRHSVAWT